MNDTKQVLIVIDVQNDYFPGGKMPLWNVEETLNTLLRAVDTAKTRGIPVVLVQHVADPARSASGFFLDKSEGVKLHPDLLAKAPDALVVIKRFADAFKETRLLETVESLGAKSLLFCGMQTQNCVGLTAISTHAAQYQATILGDCCTAETRMVHLLALSGFGDRVPVSKSDAALAL